ncbi:MAG: SIMPL domain-containing protein [Phycisphaerales bacterium]|nr:SIMPL domain-containing protein [Phycisphaerales bacterium]
MRAATSAMTNALAAALAASLLLAPAAAARQDGRDAPQAEAAPRNPTLVVEGSATVEVEPDQLIVQATVRTTSAKAASATDNNAKKAKAVVEALEKLDLGGGAVTTSRFTVQPRWSYPKGQAARLEGFEVLTTVAVRTADVHKAGEIIAAAIEAGASEIGGVSFGLSDPASHRGKAIAQAADNARRDAATLAQGMGVRLLRPLRIALDRASGPIAPAADYRAAPVAAAAMPDITPPTIRADTIRLSASVTVVYEVEPTRNP